MASFDFISDEELRATLAADYDEMTRCIGVEAWKAAQALAGGIVEAILLDYLLTTGTRQHKGKDVMALELGPLIGAAKEAGILSERTERMSDVVRDSRNLIHPGKVRRGGETATKDTAQVAQALVNIIIEEVGVKRRETYGLTAAQVVDTVLHNPTALYILPHLLRDMKQPVEWERLLTKALPKAYFLQVATFPHESEPTYSEERVAIMRENMRVLAQCFRQAFDEASEEAKTKAARNFVRVLREEARPNVLAYEISFFRCTDLQYLTPDEQALVKQHVLSRFTSEAGNLSVLVEVTGGIGEYLSTDEARSYARCIMRAIEHASAKRKEVSENVLFLIGIECSAMRPDARKAFDESLRFYATLSPGGNNSESVKLVQRLQNVMDVLDIPPANNE